MNSSYIYAGTVAYTLQQKLPTENQRELLFSATDYAEFFKAVQDTFVGPYVAKEDKDKLTDILDTIVLDAKNELVRIAPEPQLLEVLWLKYDFQNLKTLMKWDALSLSEEELSKSWIHLGNHSKDELLNAYREGTLSFLNKRLHQAFEESKKEKTSAHKDLVLDSNYLRSIRDLSPKVNNAFIKAYSKIHIDLFNLISQLRNLSEPDTEDSVNAFFVKGGSFTKKDIESVDAILKYLLRYGGPHHWGEAIAQYTNEGRFSGIDKASDEYILGWLKRQSIELYSPAPLFAYFTAIKSSVQMIRAVAVAKQLGLEEAKLRTIIRKSYREYAL